MPTGGTRVERLHGQPTRHVAGEGWQCRQPAPRDRPAAPRRRSGCEFRGIRGRIAPHSRANGFRQPQGIHGWSGSRRGQNFGQCARWRGCPKPTFWGRPGAASPVRTRRGSPCPEWGKKTGLSKVHAAHTAAEHGRGFLLAEDTALFVSTNRTSCNRHKLS